MEVQLPKDYICKCQCAVKLIITYPTEACTVAGPYPMVIFSSGFQVRGCEIPVCWAQRASRELLSGPSSWRQLTRGLVWHLCPQGMAPHVD